jgi:spermidine dehydrogenase
MSDNDNELIPKVPDGVNPISEKEAKKLGMGENMTRRDFMGSTLLGVGAGLMTMAAPGVIRSAFAKPPVGSSGLEMTGLTSAWTGPGGIGDYAKANGNTHEVVNAAHGDIRNHDLDKYLATATETGETLDLIVVGSGISGISAAYTFNKERPNAKVLLLDQHPVFGGEAKQNEFEVDGTHLWAPQGSTGMVFPAEQAKKYGFYSEFEKELGFPDEFVFQTPKNLSSDYLIARDAWSPMHVGWEQADIGYFYESKGFVKNAWANGWKDAPIPDKQKLDMMILENYRTPPRRPDWEKWLDSMTYQDFITKVVGVGPEVTQYFNHEMSAMGCGLGADIVSAYSALNFLQPGVIGYMLDLEKSKGDPSDEVYLVSLPGGNAAIARRLVQKMIPGSFSGKTFSQVVLGSINFKALDNPNQSVKMRLSSTVIAVAHDGDPATAKGVVVCYVKNGKLYKARAKAVIMAGQQHVNRHICRDIPKSYHDAMSTFHHAPMLTINVALKNWKFLDKLGISAARWFEGFGWWLSLRRNVLIDGKETMPLDPNKPVVLTMYNPFPLPGVPFPTQCTAARMQLFGMSYADIEGAVRQQLTKMFASSGFDAKRDIVGITTNRWGHAYVVDPPGFFFGKDGKEAPKDIIRRRFNRMAFSHSELTGAQMWETAAEEGTRAAKQIMEII